jgi:hypothetical protein
VETDRVGVIFFWVGCGLGKVEAEILQHYRPAGLYSSEEHIDYFLIMF